MNKHYMRLLTDVELSQKQKMVWYKAVETFLSAEVVTTPTEFLDTLTTQHAELEGDDEFPHVYVVYLSDDIDHALAEQVVELWSRIYPRDFEIESSAELDCCDDCAVEIDDAMHEEIQRRASKFIHNRWVETQVTEGWRFGLERNKENKTSPQMRDWDSLREEYRREIQMTREEATDFLKKHSHLFT